MLLRRQAPDESDDGPPVRGPEIVEGLAAAAGGEPLRVDAPPPPVQARDAVRRQVLHRGGGRGERAVAGRVDGPGPRPGRLRHGADPVGGGEPGDVGLVDRHRRDVQCACRGRTGRAQDERRGQVDHVGREVPEGVVHARAGRAHGQRGHHRDPHGGDPVDRITQVVVRSGRTGGAEQRRHGAHQRVGPDRIGCPAAQADVAGRRDHQAVVAVPTCVLEDPHDGIGDAVDAGQERFGDDGYAHTVTVSRPDHRTVISAGRCGELVVSAGEPLVTRRHTRARRAV